MHFAAMGILGMIHDICVSLGNVYFFIFFWDVVEVNNYIYIIKSVIFNALEREREC